jgi:hypothetical protein
MIISWISDHCLPSSSPVTQLIPVPGAGEIDPVRDERTDREKHLPEGHDFAADVGGSHLSDIDGTSS